LSFLVEKRFFRDRRKTLKNNQNTKKNFSSLRNDRQPAAVHPGEAILDHKVLDGAQASRGGVDCPNGAEVEAALRFFFPGGERGRGRGEEKLAFFCFFRPFVFGNSS